MINCPRCGEEFILGGDFDFEDYDYDGHGIVSNYSCPTDWCNIYMEMFVPESTRLIDIFDKVKKKDSLSQTDKSA